MTNDGRDLIFGGDFDPTVAEPVIERFALVDRDPCHCGLVIITAANATPERIVEALERHVRTPEHRAYSVRRALAYDTSPEAPLAYPAASAALSRGDSPRSAEVEVRAPSRVAPSGGASTPSIVRSDAYESQLPQQRSRP